MPGVEDLYRRRPGRHGLSGCLQVGAGDGDSELLQRGAVGLTWLGALADPSDGRVGDPDEATQGPVGVVGENGQHIPVKPARGRVVVVVDDLVEAADDSGVDVVEPVGFLPDAAYLPYPHRSSSEQPAGASPARRTVKVEELVLGVQPVFTQDLSVAFDQHEGRVGVGLLPVGGDPIGGSGRVVEVVPLQMLPLGGVCFVGGDEAKPGGIRPFRVAERVDVGDEQEIEGLDLFSPGPTGVPCLERSSQGSRADGDAANGWQLRPGRRRCLRVGACLGDP